MIKFKNNFWGLICLATMTVALGFASSGCFLIPASHSKNLPIHQYAASGDAGAVAQDLSTNKCDLNARDDAGRTPLDLAVIHCQTNVISLLLDRGAKTNIRAQGGATPLHLAAQEGCVDAVKLLLAKGAKVNAKDDQGKTPLDRALEWHQDEVVELLRQHGGKD
jgi:ankyrin repeat protein